MVKSKPRPARADVCIIGAGASGAAAAKVLCEAGVNVVGLERGPWRTRDTFGGDELANINRYNLWPDPLLNPRTTRGSARKKPRVELCPVPQTVGGGTVHWQGWLPRFTPEDFRLRTVAGEVKGASLADWPISYDELEPYYSKIEWAFGVSGQAGANKFEGPRSQGYPCPPLPTSRYAEKCSQGLRLARLERVSHPQAAPVAGVQQQRGAVTVIERLRPAARRPDRDALQRPQSSSSTPSRPDISDRVRSKVMPITLRLFVIWVAGF